MIRIGKVWNDGPELGVDLETLLRTRLLITASSGGGKTGTLLELCEQLTPKVQTIIIDPEGEFSVLRAKLPFVLVGPDGETPAMVRTAGLLAHRLLELGASAILDIYELPMWQKHEYVRDFLNALIAAPKNLWKPLIVIVDEAHIFAPEKGQPDSVALAAMADLASRGRKRGYCAILATQRLAKLSKNVAAECQNVLVGRTTQVDQARAADVLNINVKSARDAFGQNVGRLPTGQFFAYGMAFKRDLPTLFVVDRAETLPRPGAHKVVVPPPPSAIKALLPKLSDLPAEAENKAKTEAELKTEIAELKRQLKQSAAPTTITPERERMLLDQIAALEKTGRFYEAVFDNMDARASQVIESMQHLKNEMSEARKSGAVQIAAKIPSPAKIPEPAKMIERALGIKVRSGAERMLAVIAQWHPNGRTEAQVAAQVQMKRTGGTWMAYKSDLRKHGYLEIRDNKWFATEAGMAYFGGNIPDTPITTHEIMSLWEPKLRSGAVNMLRALIARANSPITREELGVAVGMEPRGGTFSAYLSDLRTANLIITDGSLVRANRETLFL